MGSKEKQGALVKLLKIEKTVAQISKVLHMPHSTVYKAIKRYRELGTYKDRPRSGRLTTACTLTNIQKVRCHVYRNSGKSMRKMAKKIGISRWAVGKICKTHLKLKSYKYGQGQYLSDEMKQRRLKNAKRLLKLKDFCSVLFTDEKIFFIEQAINRQNNRRLLQNKTDMCSFLSSF